jgi:hypothetical protein
MATRAYLVMHVSNCDYGCTQRPAISGMGIYSEPCPSSIEGHFPVVVLEEPGRNYAEAVRNLFSSLTTPAFAWALRELVRNPRHTSQARRALLLLRAKVSRAQKDRERRGQ